MGVAQAGVCQEPPAEIGCRAGVLGQDALGCRCGAQPREYRGHTPWVADAPEEGDHARAADALAKKSSKSMRTTTRRPTCGATNVRTLRPGTKPCATSDTGIPESTSSSSQRWIRLRRGFGASSSLQPPPKLLRKLSPPVVVVA